MSAPTTQGCSEAAEQPVGEINVFGWGADTTTRECGDCSHEFHIDSSPEFDRCWMCAERADAEAGAS